MKTPTTFGIAAAAVAFCLAGASQAIAVPSSSTAGLRADS